MFDSFVSKAFNLFNIMAVMRNESYQLSFFVMETAKIQIRH